MTEVNVKHQPIGAQAAELDQGIWRNWLEKGRVGDVRSRQRAMVAFALTPALVAFAWFWFQM